MSVKENSGEIIERRRALLRKMRAGYGSPGSDDPNRFFSEDGTGFMTEPERVVYDAAREAKRVGERTYRKERERHYRSA